MSEENDTVDEFVEDESFAEMLQESLVKPVRFHQGQKIKARIVKISTELIFLDLGGKSEGYLDKKELLDEEGDLSVKEGDIIEAYFLSEVNNELRFTTKITGGEAARYHLEEAWRSGIPLEGFVEKEIKGGFEVKIAGGLRAFCPFSQMGLARVESPSDFVGKHLSFRITQYGEKGRNIVVSNRSVLEEERQRQKEILKESLREGMRVKGTISSIRNFGAFVIIDAIEGLIPISEISWDRVDEIKGLLEVGQEVEVVAMKLDWENNRFSFSLKQALPDPWENIEKDFADGSVHSGTVVRLTNFGAFVSLASGVDGLLHISKLGAGKRINHPREVVTKGQVIDVKIDSIDKANKRLALSLAAAQHKKDERVESEEGDHYRDYLKSRSDSMGTLADLLKAKMGNKKK